MLRNYFKTAWRNLWKNKFFTLINVTGLTVGMSVGILILLWVQDEYSFDRFHKKTSRIYRLENQVGTGASTQIWQSTAAPIGSLGKKQLPEIRNFVRLSYNDFYSLFKYEDKVFEENNTGFADPTFFTFFDFHLIKGNPANPFPNDHSIVIPEKTASRYFGDEDPIGKVVTANDSVNFTITGVIKDFPKNSSISGDMFLPMSLLSKHLYANNPAQNLDNDFVQFNYATYLELQDGADLTSLPGKLRDIHLKVKPDDVDILYLLLPLSKMHLYKADGTNGGIETVKMFLIIAILILVIACINYVNLSTSRSMLRAKEVSLRKIVGAGKAQLFSQFIVETTILFCFATLLSLGLMYVLLPIFNRLSGKEMVMDYSNFQIWKIIIYTILGTLAASSIYPALLLSSFEPLKALKGKISARISDKIFRKVLVVVQFAVSVILIAGTLVIGSQLKFIRSRELGYDKEHVLSFPMRAMNDHFDAVKTDLLKQPGVLNITRASSNIVRIGGQTGDNWWDGRGKEETMMVRPMAIDRDFLSFFKMKMNTGNNFTGAVADSAHFILNETAVRTARIKDPIGKKFKLWNKEGTIIGIAKDFHFSSLKNKIEPVVFYYTPEAMGRIYIKTTAADASKAIAAASNEWKQYNAGFPFSYAFLDETFNNLYQSEQRTGGLFNSFAAIAILISCLGLFGLTAYTAQLRTREIGVRKVLGCSIPGIIRLLASDFISLVLIAIVIAVPVSWYVMNQWLQDFAYKIHLGWTVFLLSGLVAVGIALVTISFQSIKAALTNPVKSLRSE